MYCFKHVFNNLKSCFLLLFFIVGINLISISQTVTTIAGVLSVTGNLNGLALSSTFNNPHGVEVDNLGNVYIADRYNHVIRKLDSNGNVTVFAGSGTIGNTDGQGTSAQFHEPWALTLDALGNVYVADTKNNKIRKITPSGLVTTIAGTGNFGMTNSVNPLAASFGNPTGIAIDSQNNLYISDHLTHIIRKISNTGVVTTFAGNTNYPNNYGLVDGSGTTAKFYRPYGIEIDKFGNIYVADEWNHAVRKISSTGIVSTLAGNGNAGSVNGNGLAASFKYPWDVTVDTLGNVYVADGSNYVIRKINSTNDVTTYAGIMGTSGAVNNTLLTSTFNGATSISLSPNNNYFVVGDAYNQIIRQIIPHPTSNPIIEFTDFPTDTIVICEGTNVDITLTGTFDSYDVFIDGVFSMNTSTLSVSLQNLIVGNHTVNIDGIYGSNQRMTSNRLYVNVLNNEIFTLDVTPHNNLCIGDSVIISTSNSVFVTWNTGEIGNNITVASTGMYYPTSYFEQCKITIDTVHLTFNPYPQSPTITQIFTSPVYVGDTITLIANSSSGNLSYLWSNQSITNQIDVTEAGNYFVTVTNSFGCSITSSSISLNFIPLPISLEILHPDSLNYCKGDSLKISANYSNNIYWMKDGFLMNVFDSILYIKSPGEYWFQKDITPDSTIYSDTILIIEKALPFIDFQSVITEKTKQHTSIEFTPTIQNYPFYQWTIDSLPISNDIILNYEFDETKYFAVDLLVTDSQGCSSIVTRNYPIEVSMEVFVASGFSPNNDGVNDVLKVRGLPKDQEINFLIFNEWGELVFSTTNVENGWNGNFKGQSANVGNYSYLLEYTIEGNKKSLKGIITLLK